MADKKTCFQWQYSLQTRTSRSNDHITFRMVKGMFDKIFISAASKELGVLRQLIESKLTASKRHSVAHGSTELYSILKTELNQDSINSIADLLGVNLQFVRQSKFMQWPGNLISKLNRYVEQCDALIHIVGDDPGHPSEKVFLEPFLKSRDWPCFFEGNEELRVEILDRCEAEEFYYTHWEPYFAIDINIPVFVFDVRTKDAKKQQGAHLELLKTVLPQKFPDVILSLIHI